MKTLVVNLSIHLHTEDTHNLQAKMRATLKQHIEFLKTEKIGSIGKQTIPGKATILWNVGGWSEEE